MQALKRRQLCHETETVAISSLHAVPSPRVCADVRAAHVAPAAGGPRLAR